MGRVPDRTAVHGFINKLVIDKTMYRKSVEKDRRQVFSVATEEISSVASSVRELFCGQELSSVATEEISSVATDEISSVATEEISSVATEKISSLSPTKRHSELLPTTWFEQR